MSPPKEFHSLQSSSKTSSTSSSLSKGNSTHMKTLLLFILPSFAQVLLITILPFASADLVDSTCNKTPYPVFCATALGVDPQSSTADTKTLGLIMVDQVQAHASSTLTKIKYLRGRVPHPMTKQALSSCEHKYRIIISAMVPPSKEGLMEGDYKFAVEYMNAAANDALECEAGFGGSKSALSDSNDYVRKAAMVASAIASLLL